MRDFATQPALTAKRLKQCGLFIQRFRKDEDGGIIILTLLLLVAMLVVSGMAVDFMRVETQRSQLQSLADRSVLASANLSQTLDAKDVVESYHEKAGMLDKLSGDPVSKTTINGKTVTVNSVADINTFYLRLIGNDSLQAPVEAQAVQGIPNVEISLVLDISASMKYGIGPHAGKTKNVPAPYRRYDQMLLAAEAFSDIVLSPTITAAVSLNIVPYAGSVNPQPEVFDNRTGSTRLTTPGFEAKHAERACIEPASIDYTHSKLPWREPGESGRPQIPFFMVWHKAGQEDDLIGGWCPNDNTAIAYAMDTSAKVRAYINEFDMFGGTGTDIAMKYGLALLDPDSRSLFSYLNSQTWGGTRLPGYASEPMVPSQFTNRPSDWLDDETTKILILMTDGRATGQYRPVFPTSELNLNKTFLQKNKEGGQHRRTPKMGDRPAEDVLRTGAFDNLIDICNLAKDETTRNVVVYTVAFEIVDPNHSAKIKECANDDAHFFDSSGNGLIEAFEEIALQITQLRLTQ